MGSVSEMGESAGNSTGALVQLGMDYFSPAAKRQRQDMKALKRGQLGISEAEQDRMAGASAEAARAMQSTAAQAIQQQAAASGGPTAATQRALGQLGAGAGNAAAGARMQASIASGQQAAARREAILAKSKEATQRAGALVQQNIAQGMKSGGAAIDTYMDAAGGGLGSVTSMFGGAAKGASASGGSGLVMPASTAPVVNKPVQMDTSQMGGDPTAAGYANAVKAQQGLQMGGYTMPVNKPLSLYAST